MEQFSVSIKGVLKLNNKFLLRRNERGEFELLGGRLEKSDASLEQRLETEFFEESGIKVKVLEAREPWLYQVGTGRVVIVPFVCSCLNIPDKLDDSDGGTLHWINSDQINNLFMPQGYKDTINGVIPRTSSSLPAKKIFKIIHDYLDYKYCVRICLKHDEEILFCEALQSDNFINNSILEIIYKNLECHGRIKFQSVMINNSHDTVTLNYIME